MQLSSKRAAMLSALSVAFSIVSAAPALRAQSFDWQQSPVSGRWYSEGKAPSSWSGAEELAQRLGGHLATVRSQAESDWLDQQFFSRLVLFRHHWIGLRQERSNPSYAEPSGGWGWASGDPLTFTNWAPGQPDNAGGEQDFGRTGGNSGGSTQAWHDDTDFARPGFGGADDWYIGPGQVVVFNTSLSTIQLSTVQFVPGTDQVQSVLALGATVVRNGVVEVDDFVIEAGGVLQLVGPNAFVLMARGRVVLSGQVDASGANARCVETIDTTNIPEPGAPGRAGGGAGGTGSPLTTASTPVGGSGLGAFGRPGEGGGGGETGWANVAPDNSRRGAGGGGGRTGPDVLASAGPGLHEQRRVGFDAEAGFDSTLAHHGALTGQPGARGGAVGLGAFRDANPNNDFFGRAVDAATGNVVVGELVRPWAGAGGGAGGDAAFVASGSFPAPFLPTGDEKGAGGGGGGGSVHVLAQGPIVFGIAGQVLARGGVGGGGENTIYLNRIGGGSGGGSGGHVVLQSSRYIDFRARDPLQWELPSGAGFAVDTRGGQGGVGLNNTGGAYPTGGSAGESVASNDACPTGYSLYGTNSCRGPINGAGGDGGPGIVQLHTPMGRLGSDPATADILVAPGIEISQYSAPIPFGLVAGGTRHLVPDIGEGLALFELNSDDCDGDGVPDAYEIALDPALDTDRDGILDTCDGSLSYCVQGTPAGCVAVLAANGLPSASAGTGFELVASSVLGQRSGQIFYGLAPASTPFGVGQLCVGAPIQRLSVGTSGGTAGTCDGELRLDWNAWRAAYPTALGAPFSAGQMLYSQAWFREFSGGTEPTLTNALRFTLSP